MSAVLGFEAFIGANFKLRSFDELVRYIDNIEQEEFHEELTMLRDSKEDLVDETLEWLFSHCDFEVDEFHFDAVNLALTNMCYGRVERVLLKNNLFRFLSIDEMAELYRDCAVEDFTDANSPPKSVEDSMEILVAYAEYFVLYPYQWGDLHERVETMERRVVVLSDTDSTFLYLNPLVKWQEQRFGQDLSGLKRLGCVSVATHLASHLVNRIFQVLTKNLNVPEERRGLINMKNELEEYSSFRRRRRSNNFLNCWETLRASRLGRSASLEKGFNDYPVREYAQAGGNRKRLPEAMI